VEELRMHWDVIIVGARCAGAALGTALARAGLKTLIIEAHERGADLPMSTHLMQPAGMDALDRLGIGDGVRAVTPATTRLRLALDDAELITEHRPGYCVRRRTLDPLLQMQAEASGAELRCSTRVIELLRDHERVVGVVVDGSAGREQVRADFVVGADGARSTVARLTGSREYLVHESTRGGYFAYYPAPARWERPWHSTLEHRGQELRTVFRTDGGLMLLAAVVAARDAESWGRGYRERLHQLLLASPTTRPFVEDKEPVGKVRGLLRPRYFYREATGSGWALIGDAGTHKDFSTAQGMTDALLDAERLTRALLSQAREAALEHFWRERDLATLPVFFDALAQGDVGYNTPFMRWVIARAAVNPSQLERVSRMINRELSHYALIPPARLTRWMAEATLQRRTDVLAGLAVLAKQRLVETKELEQRRALCTWSRSRLQARNVAAKRWPRWFATNQRTQCSVTPDATRLEQPLA
jgi:menaquinone-9 beta-reductase